MIDIHEILHLNNQLNKLIEQKDDLEKEKYEELKKIEIKYSKLLNSICETSTVMRKELSKYSNDLVRKATFKIDYICSIISEIISKIEGEDYYYFVANYNGYYSNPSTGELYLTETSLYHLIGKNPEYKYEEKCSLNERYKFLTEEIINIKRYIQPATPDDKVSFYLCNSYDTIDKTIDFKGFDYVYDFINELINYKLINNVDDIDDEVMEYMKNKFINDKIKCKTKKKVPKRSKNGKQNKKDV